MMSNDELRAKLLEELPHWVEMCESRNLDAVILHQNAFSTSEAELLGLAIKYAGMCGKEVRVVPTKLN